MPVLQDRVDALLYLLDRMVGIDGDLDEQEATHIAHAAHTLLEGDSAAVFERLKYVSSLWRQYNQDALFVEACDIISQSPTLQDDLLLFKQVAHADGKIDPSERAFFQRILHQLGIR